MHMEVRFGLAGVHTVVLENVHSRSAECPDCCPANLRGLSVDRSEQVCAYVQRRG